MPRHRREGAPTPLGLPPVNQYLLGPQDLLVTSYGVMGTVPANHTNFMLETKFTYLSSVGSVGLFSIPDVLAVSYDHLASTIEFTRNPGQPTQNKFSFAGVVLTPTNHILFNRDRGKLTLLINGQVIGQYVDFWYRMMTGVLTSTDNSTTAMLSFSRWSPWALEEAETLNFANIQAA